jgi:DNA-binding NarL/FixJ family response regulator
VLKDVEKEDLLRSIRAAARGEAIFGPGVATRVVDCIFMIHPAVSRVAFPTLSEPEQELFHLLARGQSNASIALPQVNAE